MRLPPLEIPLGPPAHDIGDNIRHRPQRARCQRERDPDFRDTQRPLRQLLQIFNAAGAVGGAVHRPLLIVTMPGPAILRPDPTLGARAVDVGASLGDHGADDILDEHLGRGGHEFGAEIGGAVGEGFLVADGHESGLDGGGVGKFEGFLEEGVSVAFADFEIPVCTIGAESQLRVLVKIQEVWAVMVGISASKIVELMLTGLVKAACAGGDGIGEFDRASEAVVCHCAGGGRGGVGVVAIALC